MRAPRTSAHAIFLSLARQDSSRVKGPADEMAVNAVILTGANGDTAARAALSYSPVTTTSPVLLCRPRNGNCSLDLNCVAHVVLSEEQVS